MCSWDKYSAHFSLVSRFFFGTATTAESRASSGINFWTRARILKHIFEWLWRIGNLVQKWQLERARRAVSLPAEIIFENWIISKVT